MRDRWDDIYEILFRFVSGYIYMLVIFVFYNIFYFWVELC